MVGKPALMSAHFEESSTRLSSLLADATLFAVELKIPSKMWRITMLHVANINGVPDFSPLCAHSIAGHRIKCKQFNHKDRVII